MSWKNNIKKSIVYPILLLLFLPIIFAGFESSTKISTISTFEGFDHPDGVWVLSFTEDGFTTDVVHAKFDKKTLSSKQDFSIDVDGTENYCKYDIKREGRELDIFTVEIISNEDTFWSWEYDYEELQDLGKKRVSEMGCLAMDDYAEGYPAALEVNQGVLRDELNIVCYRKKEVLGQIGSLQNLKYVTKTRWDVKAEGKTKYSAEIGNEDAKQGRTSNLGNDVTIRWQGQLSSGETCPLTTEALMAYDQDFSGNWRTINRGSYRDYASFMRANLDIEIIAVAQGTKDEESVESIINNKALRAIQERDLDFSPAIIDSSLNNGALKVNLERQIRFPKFTMYVDSDYLEVEFLVGKPKIDCPSSILTPISIREGDLKTGQLEVTVKNKGKQRGSFELRIKDCGEGFAAGDSTAFRLDGGESAKKKLLTTLEIAEGETIKGKCRIELEETTTGEIDSCYIYLTGEKPAVCEEGDIWCGYKEGKSVIKKCVDGKEKITETCEEDEICDFVKGNVVCRGKEEGEGVVCKDWFAIAGWTLIPNMSKECVSWYSTFVMIMAAAGALLTFLFIYLPFAGRYPEQKKVILIVALLLGGLAGLFVYLYYWLILIVLIIGVILRIAIGKKKIKIKIEREK